VSKACSRSPNSSANKQQSAFVFSVPAICFFERREKSRAWYYALQIGYALPTLCDGSNAEFKIIEEIDMNKLIKGFLMGAFFAMIGSSGMAADRGTPDEAMAMVKKAVAYIKANGKEKSFADFGNTANAQFHDRDLYIFVYDLNGVSLAHGNNPKMVGKNLIDMKDNSGVPIIKTFIDVANSKGKGWVDYKWPNPVTKAVESKSSYVEKLDDMIVGCGIYKN
jgi:cytochrome c